MTVPYLFYLQLDWSNDEISEKVLDDNEDVDEALQLHLLQMELDESDGNSDQI